MKKQVKICTFSFLLKKRICPDIVELVPKLFNVWAKAPPVLEQALEKSVKGSDFSIKYKLGAIWT
ncbi:hypothetical protein FACS189483_00920 [Spirochaetia bacterium]|nr:hypothetical protein FACS189483_00920 [Spirochaetia bacterium]